MNLQGLDSGLYGRFKDAAGCRTERIEWARSTRQQQMHRSAFRRPHRTRSVGNAGSQDRVSNGHHSSWATGLARVGYGNFPGQIVR